MDFSLPVELSAFSATASVDGVKLAWRTESEVNNIGFNLYRSTHKDGPFTKVGFVEGHGSTPVAHEYTFIDKTAVVGETYYYYLEDVDVASNTERSDVISVAHRPITPDPRTLTQPPPAEAVLPSVFRLRQNFPNPFNPETWLPYELPEATNVEITIYDSRGRVVKTLSVGQQLPGYYTDQGSAAYWDGSNESGERVSNGAYYYALDAGTFSAVRKMVIAK